MKSNKQKSSLKKILQLAGARAALEMTELDQHIPEMEAVITRREKECWRLREGPSMDQSQRLRCSL